jgi:glycine cleavage system H protein
MAQARTGQVQQVVVDGFPLALDRRYHPETHMWVLASGPGRVKIGMGPLGIETSGSLVQLSFLPAGSELEAGRPFGQLEAAKFVGPLVSPVSGVVLAVNEAVAMDAGLAERDPYGDGWMIEADLGRAGPGGTTAELVELLADPAEIMAWFAAKIAGYRSAGVIAQ